MSEQEDDFIDDSYEDQSSMSEESCSESSASDDSVKLDKGHQKSKKTSRLKQSSSDDDSDEDEASHNESELSSRNESELSIRNESRKQSKSRIDLTDDSDEAEVSYNQSEMSGINDFRKAGKPKRAILEDSFEYVPNPNNSELPSRNESRKSSSMKMGALDDSDEFEVTNNKYEVSEVSAGHGSRKSGIIDNSTEFATSYNQSNISSKKQSRRSSTSNTGIIDVSTEFATSYNQSNISSKKQSRRSSTSNTGIIDVSAEFATSYNQSNISSKKQSRRSSTSNTGIIDDSNEFATSYNRSSISTKKQFRRSSTSNAGVIDDSCQFETSQNKSEISGRDQSRMSSKLKSVIIDDSDVLGTSKHPEISGRNKSSPASTSATVLIDDSDEIEASCDSASEMSRRKESRKSSTSKSATVIEDSNQYETSPNKSNLSDRDETGKLHGPETIRDKSKDIHMEDTKMFTNLEKVKVDYGRESFRISRNFNIRDALSSTIMEAPATPNKNLFSEFDGKLVRSAMLTPREVKPAIRSRSPSPDSVEIISDDSGDEAVVLVKTPLKQPTLIEMLKRNSAVKDEPPEVLSVSARELDDQKRKVQSLQFDAQKAKNMLMTFNLATLPDKGSLLQQRQAQVMELLRQEEEKLNKMIWDKQKDVPKALGPKAASWQELDNNFGTVQPRTFGKQAMATHNQQKALTMDRLHQLHGSLKSCPTEETLAADPKGLVVELMPHQKRALAWLMWREKQKPAGGILADDMGLGKTLTMISVMLKTREEKEMQEDSEEEENDENAEGEGRRKSHKYTGGTLIVCPASLISQWDGEVKKRVKRGRISVELYHGPRRETKAKRLSRPDMVITTYSIVNNEYQKSTPLFTIKWDRIILDEAHQIRNHKAQTSIAACALAAKARWALTGTPIHNKEGDLYALLKFLRCTPFDDLAVFKRWVSEKNTGGQERLNTVMSSLMLRRTKAQLQEQGALECLPERSWEIVEVKLEKQEMDVYQKILIFSRTLFSQYLHQRAEKTQDMRGAMEAVRPSFAQSDPKSEYSKMHQRLVQMNKVKEVKQHEILVLLLRLRQICCHPSLITAMLESQDLNETCGGFANKDDSLDILDQLNKLQLEDEYDPQALEVRADGDGVGLAEASRGILNPSHPIFNVNRRSTKVDAVLELLKNKILNKDDKCIIVSQWTSFLKLLAAHLKSEDIVFDQLDGTIPVPKRAALIDNFNNPKSGVKILLLSLTAGGVGLNLVGANHLLLLDLHWNPQLEMQAQDRIYRVGQEKPVHVYKFVTMDTIEERIKSLQDFKKNLAEAMLTGAKLQQTKLSIDDLKMLFNM